MLCGFGGPSTETSFGLMSGGPSTETNNPVSLEMSQLYIYIYMASIGTQHQENLPTLGPTHGVRKQKQFAAGEIIF